MNNKHQVPPHEHEEEEIIQQISGRVEAIWATVPSFRGVNLEIEQLLAQERRKKVGIINDTLGQVAIHLKKYASRLPKARDDMQDGHDEAPNPKNIVEAKQQLASLAAHSWEQARNAPRYWLMIVGGGIMTLALLLEVAIAFEWFAGLWRDGRGQLSAEYFALAMFFALLTALAIGVILHQAYVRMPRLMKKVGLVVLALLAISIIIAAPLSVVITQPGMTGNSLIVSDDGQQLFKEFSQLAMAARALLFVVAAAVATLGIELIRNGVRGLAVARQARCEAAEHEKYLKELTKVEEMATAMTSEEQRKHEYINIRFTEASRNLYLQEARRLERYLRGERYEPANREQLDERLQELMAAPDQGGNANDELEAFARGLAKRYMPVQLNLADLPPANELPSKARALIKKHAQWLQWMATQTEPRLKKEV